MKKARSVIWGIVLIVVGLVFALNALGLTDIDVFFPGWWTLFIIIPCGVGLFTGKDRIGNLIGLGIGGLLLLGCQGVDLGFIWKLIVPAIIILIGVKLIVGSFHSGKTERIIDQIEQNGQTLHNGFTAFSGSKVNFDGQTFRGAELNAVFGGIEYDLRHALIPADCVIKAAAIFGGIDIFLPDDVNVQVVSNSIFGGVDNRKGNTKVEGRVTVFIEGSGIFGGVDIK